MSEAFRAVEWMRKRRAEIDEEDRALTWDQKSKRTKELLEAEEIWRRLKRCVVRVASPVARRA